MYRINTPLNKITPVIFLACDPRPKTKLQQWWLVNASIPKILEKMFTYLHKTTMNTATNITTTTIIATLDSSSLSQKRPSTTHHHHKQIKYRQLLITFSLKEKVDVRKIIIILTETNTTYGGNISTTGPMTRDYLTLSLLPLNPANTSKTFDFNVLLFFQN